MQEFLAKQKISHVQQLQYSPDLVFATYSSFQKSNSLWDKQYDMYGKIIIITKKLLQSKNKIRF